MFRTLKPLILASGSPRRKRLLSSLGIDFLVEPSNIDEDTAPGKTPAEAAIDWALMKARSVAALYPGSWVLGADTVVALDGEIFGKPASPEDNFRMLSALGGRQHEVTTGMGLIGQSGEVWRSGSVTSAVTFKNMTNQEIEAYIRTGEPADKAGGYGIQGIGAFLVRSVAGSYTNVVGLPLCEIVDWLLEAGIIEPE